MFTITEFPSRREFEEKYGLERNYVLPIEEVGWYALEEGGLHTLGIIFADPIDDGFNCIVLQRAPHANVFVGAEMPEICFDTKEAAYDTLHMNMSRLHREARQAS